MDKPDWRDAPEWANFMFQDKTDVWFWAEVAPEISNIGWLHTRGRIQRASVYTTDGWRESLEPRP